MSTIDTYPLNTAFITVDFILHAQKQHTLLELLQKNSSLNMSAISNLLSVPLNDVAIRVLKKRIGMHPVYVFTFKGRAIDQVSTRAWRKALKRCGISFFRWHDLRHT